MSVKEIVGYLFGLLMCLATFILMLILKALYFKIVVGWLF